METNTGCKDGGANCRAQPRRRLIRCFFGVAAAAEILQHPWLAPGVHWSLPVQTAHADIPGTPDVYLLSGNISNAQDALEVYRVKKTSFQSGGYEVDMRAVKRKKADPEDDKANAREKERDFNRKIGAARRDVRHRVKAFGCERLVTLTRSPAEGAWSIDDWKRAVSRFIATLRRRGCQLQYVAVPQRHKSGQWHVHIAVNASIPVDVARSAWTAEAGSRSRVVITRHIRDDRLTRVAKIGSYITKTLDVDWLYFPTKAKRFWSSLGGETKQSSWYIRATSFKDALEKLAQQLRLDVGRILECEECRVMLPAP